MENQRLYPSVPEPGENKPTPSAPSYSPMREQPPSYEQTVGNPLPSVHQPVSELQPLDPAAMNRGPQPIIIQQAAFGPECQVVYCGNCGQNRTTKVEYESGLKTHLIAVVLCLTSLWPCACCPYCCCQNEICKYATHYCEECGNYLGVHKNCL